ncbi:uncharacterized protein [Miscanthus floridulus]|uniref:uncharacterized protein n=1 Tax=Miscanthus floridulus TaxID=154761 RepID=UPI003457B9D6
MAEGRGPPFSVDEHGVVRYKDRLVVPSNEELKRKILNEAHHSKLSIHPGSNKMYQDLHRLYWWSYMKQDITQYESSYQESIRMAPIEALYGQKCRTPLNWVEVEDRGYFRPDFIKEAREKVPEEAMEIEGLPLRPDLSYVEHPVKVLDEKERVTRNSVIKFYKVQWQNHSEDEATWEQESYIVKHYPHLLPGSDS